MLAGAMSSDAVKGSDTPFDRRIQSVRGHGGQTAVAGVLRQQLFALPGERQAQRRALSGLLDRADRFVGALRIASVGIRVATTADFCHHFLGQIVFRSTNHFFEDIGAGRNIHAGNYGIAL